MVTLIPEDCNLREGLNKPSHIAYFDDNFGFAYLTGAPDCFELVLDMIADQVDPLTE
jgi:hypothetical protein